MTLDMISKVNLYKNNEANFDLDSTNNEQDFSKIFNKVANSNKMAASSETNEVQTAEHDNKGELLSDITKIFKDCREAEKICAQNSVDMLAGRNVNPHKMMIGLKEAEMGIQLIVNVVSKTTNGLNELFRMTV